MMNKQAGFASVKRRARRVAIAVVGGLVLVVGIIAIPYPGPGWLIVFSGLAILATEFDWARRYLDSARKQYDAWQEWLKRQPKKIKAVIWSLTFLVVVVTIWLLNGYGIMNELLHLPFDWLRSPLPFFR